ncbi:transglutaminase family protein [uncultured Fibrobacter sp.]|uniref:transglutaminase family protein n=1 Tax=uncultured Fibrobacter sp. TaxID=261512 RepID=UPI00260F1F39|nr:transglutaminase family protein [uncultured Fibrobacter sp.]
MKKILLRLFWPILITVFAISLTLVLWSGRTESISFRDAACFFEDHVPGCLDTNDAWNLGLKFYDSTLAETGDTLQSLKALLWQYWKIEFAGAGKAAISADAISALRVLDTRKSGCMGLSWVAMMVAESRHIPLSVILLPGHVYLRYAGAGVPPVNMEPNREGFFYTDEEYREKYRDGHWTGLEFKPLSASNFVGLAAFDMGNLYLDSDLRRALTWFRMAEEFFPEYPGIKINQDIAKSRLPDHL